MPLRLEGSCHCKAVQFHLDSHTPVPYQMCQCSICRKVGGYMGSVNIMGDTKSLEVMKGKDKIKQYQAILDYSSGKMGTSKRHFCSECSSMLWLHDETWADWVYPFASSIDTPLPVIPGYSPLSSSQVKKGTKKEEEKPAMLSILRKCAPEYVPVPEGAVVYESYPPGEGIEAWHKKHGLWVD